MNDKAMLELALEKLNVSIGAIVKVIGTGRGIHGTAFDFNNMVQAKVIINIPQIIWDDITAKTPLVFLQGNANIQNVNLMGEQLGSYDAVFSYKNNLISSTITSSESSKINTNINLTVNQKLKLTVKGNLTPKTNNLENIFQELGINNLQNHSYNL
jgi:hypothetical protein